VRVLGLPLLLAGPFFRVMRFRASACQKEVASVQKV
jgi:hypothetical protein